MASASCPIDPFEPCAQTRTSTLHEVRPKENSAHLLVMIYTHPNVTTPKLERKGPYLIYPLADVSSDLAPIYVTRRRARLPKMEELRRNFLQITPWWQALDHKIAWITDTRQAPLMDAGQRKAYGEFLERIKPYQAKYMVASAMVVEDVRIRGEATAIWWHATPPYQLNYFSEFGEAIKWCRAELIKAGLALPE